MCALAVAHSLHPGYPFPHLRYCCCTVDVSRHLIHLGTPCVVLCCVVVVVFSEAHPRRAPGSPQAGARAVAASTASSASLAPTGTSPPSAPKVWMTPAEEQVAITALLVRGREKLIDYVGEGEMEGVGVGRPQSPARSLARSTLSAVFYYYCVHDLDGHASLSTWEYHGGTRIVDARCAVLSW
jgi:hypothetical protein